MPQFSNLRLLYSSSSSIPFRFSFKPTLSSPFLSTKPKTLLKSCSTLSVTSSSSKRTPKVPPLRSRNYSCSNKSGKGKGGLMEETTFAGAAPSGGFNKRRAEGKDMGDKPKSLQLKARKLNPVNTISYVQILGTGLDTQDTLPSVLLFFDKQRFIFNAGEGLQRYCTEHKIKLTKIDHIFLSRVCSETAGGLPGLLLTLAGIGDEGMSVNVWGSSDLKYLVDAMRSFIPNAAMVHTHSFGPTTNDHGPTEPIVLIDDEIVKISATLIRPSSATSRDDLSMLIDASMGLDEESDQVVTPLSPESRETEKTEGHTLKPGDVSVIYACELPEIKGKFDTAKAVALGLKPGPKYRELQLGNSVMSDKKNIMVHPSDVLGPSIPGPIVLLVDCPTLLHLQELSSVQSLSCYYTDAVDIQPKSVNCIIHLSPSSITLTATYQNWMKRFGGAQHIMAGHETKNIEIPILKSSARIAAQLNYLCPQFFPAPGFWSLQHLRDLAQGSSEGSVPELCDSISAENLLKFHLRPYAQLGLDRSGIPSLMSPSAVVNELLFEIPEIADSVTQVSQLWKGPAYTEVAKPQIQDTCVMTEEPWMDGDGARAPVIKRGEKSTSAYVEGISCLSVDEVQHGYSTPMCLEDITREDMEFVLLGTGSSQPSKYRNVSSIYVNLFSKGSLLLDCGEGSLGQLKRRFGVEGADNAIRDLRCIWISHIHADHHTGLARILSLRRELLRRVPHEPLIVIGPRQLKRFLDAYQRLEDLDMQFLDCRHTTEASWASFESNRESRGNHFPAGSDEDSFNKRVKVDGETSLFAKGSRMESYWKRPSSPAVTSEFQIVQKLKLVLEEAGLQALVSVPVVHCPQAFGIILKAAERNNSAGKTVPGWKLVYSGDTRPCPELIEASRGATILIHEATFEDSMVEEAIARNHSTTKEAIEVGDAAGAYRIILTHFSQRYPKIPVFDETYMHKTCIGFDLMSVNIADLPLLPKINPYFKILFKNEMVADEADESLADEADEFLGPLL